MHVIEREVDPDGVLSESLSAALERLSAAGVLDLEDRADTERRICAHC